VIKNVKEKMNQVIEIKEKKDENLFQFQCGSLDKFATVHKNN
jgi:hypothetical protein